MSTAPASALPPRPPLMPLDEALTQLRAAGQRHRIHGTEIVATQDALGRVLAASLASPVAVPPLANSAMDGYAVCAADVPETGGVLPVSQRVAAGQVGQPLQRGTAVRIFTGAPVPPGADTVVMQEAVQAATGADGQPAVQLARRPERGQWVRPRGDDIGEGAVVLLAGRRLDAAALGVAASVGAAHLAVLRRPRVALFSTGDELAMPGTVAGPGQIYNSNRYTLRGLFEGMGCVVEDLGIVPDRLEATRAALRAAAAEADLIVTSGGVSVGEEDHLRPAVTAEGSLALWQIAMKPGKPLALGTVRRSAVPEGGAQDASAASAESTESAVFVGLPGNPVSSWVTALVCVAPLLRAMQGMPSQGHLVIQAQAAFTWPKADARREFLRAGINADGAVVLHPNQNSGVLTSAAWAQGLVDLAPGQTVAPGDTVRFLPLAAWGLG